MCKNCGKDEILSVNAKCDDRCFLTYKDQERSDYVPSDLGIGGGDYVRFKVCLACGQIQDTFPKIFPMPETEE